MSSLPSNPQSSSKPTVEQVKAAAHAVGHALKEKKYAIVGGAACCLLGSQRLTEDVDFVVPQSQTPAARQILKSDSKVFEVQKRTLHTTYKSNPPVKIEILSPPALFKEPFNEATPIFNINGANILKPALVLNAKCRSILGRTDEIKKRTDAEDIHFLLDWCAINGQYPTAEEVPNANKEFVLWFIQRYYKQELWLSAGYDMESGTFTGQPRA